MGAAAEQRYVSFAGRQAESALPNHNETFVRDINKLPKREGAQTPFGDVHFVPGHGGWWAECPKTGFGYWFKSLRDAVRAFQIVVAIDGQRLIGIPGSKPLARDMHPITETEDEQS